VTVVKNEEGGNSVATVVLRGSTDSILDDLERAVDDGVNTYKVFFCFLFFALLYSFFPSLLLLLFDFCVYKYFIFNKRIPCTQNLHRWFNSPQGVRENSRNFAKFH
jgi:hypothetical protein